MSDIRFTVKNSGQSQEYKSGIVRDPEDDKPDYTLIDIDMYREMSLFDVEVAEIDDEHLLNEILTVFAIWENGYDCSAYLLRLIDEHEERAEEGNMIERWAWYMTRGAKEDGRHNWKKANSEEELEGFKRSARDHFLQWAECLNVEEDHAAAVFFNVVAAEYVMRKLEKYCNSCKDDLDDNDDDINKGLGSLNGSAYCKVRIWGP